MARQDRMEGAAGGARARRHLSGVSMADTETVLKVAVESAVLAFLPVYAEASSAEAVADWREYFGRVCRLLVKGDGSQAFAEALENAAATVEAKLALRFRGDFDAARFFTNAVLRLSCRATWAARKARAERAWWRLEWDGKGSDDPDAIASAASVASFEPAVLRGVWMPRVVAVGGTGIGRKVTRTPDKHLMAL